MIARYNQKASVTLIFLGLLLSLVSVAGTESTSGAAPAQTQAGIWTNYTNSNYVQALALQGDTLWAGTTGGVVRWDLTDGSYVKYLAPDGLPDNRVSAVVVDAAGRLWFGLGTWNGGVTVYDASTWTTFTWADGLATGWVFAVAIDGAGRKWIGTARGVSVLSDNGTPHDKGDDAWTTFHDTDGLASDDVYAIAVDGVGRKWFCTWDGGVSVLDDGGTPHDKGDDTWTTFTTADGLADNRVYTAAVDGAGRKWFGTWGGGVSVLDDSGTPHDKGDDTWTTFTSADGLADDWVYAIAVDEAGRKWFGTGYGVSVLNDGGTPHDKGDDTWTSFTTADGLADDYVQDIAFGAGNQVWFGT
jgi:hypothetical protein